ncbi:glycosyltransferase [Nocardioides sp. YIM 152588]|uniref:glycosyltransferase n=1 Tax=Nocardioides sp. YIM 152588 TaxID=3158259 RepID=UPI0032E3AEAD
MDRSSHVALAAAGAFAACVTIPLLARPGPTWTGGARLTPLTRSPSVDVMVPAYLEASTIGPKVASLRAEFERYDGAARVVVLASDDLTAAAAARAGADQVVVRPREGKAVALNTGVAGSVADVVVFTDANCEIGPAGWLDLAVDKLRESHLVTATKTESGGSERAFWLYERVLAGRSSDGETLAVAGEFLATRRADYVPLSATAILDDFELAAHYVARGRRVTKATAILTSEPAAAPADQWERRVRMAEGVLTEATPRLRHLARWPVGRHYIAHKYVRMTLGPVAFWSGVLAAAARGRGVGAAVLAATAYLVLGYRGAVPVAGPLRPVAAVVGMQAVPPAALGRMARNSWRRDHSAALWKKVPR